MWQEFTVSLFQSLGLYFSKYDGFKLEPVITVPSHDIDNGEYDSSDNENIDDEHWHDDGDDDNVDDYSWRQNIFYFDR